MYATIRFYQGDTALAGHLVDHQDSVRTLISGVTGFRSYHLVSGDAGTTSITICDDQAGADESNRLAAGWLKENAPSSAITPPQVTAGDVVIQFGAS